MKNITLGVPSKAPLYEPLAFSVLRAIAKRHPGNKRCPGGCGFWFQKVNAGWDGAKMMTCPTCDITIDPETFFDR